MLPQTDREIVAAFLAAIDDLSQSEAGRVVPGVTQSDVSRWRRGEWKRLSSEKREALRAFLEQRRAGTSAAAEAAELLAELDQVTRFLRRVGEPGQEQARKLDALEGYKQVLATLGPIPAWWYELKEKVEAGEI